MKPVNYQKGVGPFAGKFSPDELYHGQITAMQEKKNEPPDAPFVRDVKRATEAGVATVGVLPGMGLAKTTEYFTGREAPEGMRAGDYIDFFKNAWGIGGKKTAPAAQPTVAPATAVAEKPAEAPPEAPAEKSVAKTATANAPSDDGRVPITEALPGELPWFRYYDRPGERNTDVRITRAHQLTPEQRAKWGNTDLLEARGVGPKNTDMSVDAMVQRLLNDERMPLEERTKQALELKKASLAPEAVVGSERMRADVEIKKLNQIAEQVAKGEDLSNPITQLKLAEKFGEKYDDLGNKVGSDPVVGLQRLEAFLRYRGLVPPPEKFIKVLLDNPTQETVDRFDAAFGDGAAERILAAKGISIKKK